jgi:hypothetical protein
MAKKQTVKKQVVKFKGQINRTPTTEPALMRFKTPEGCVEIKGSQEFVSLLTTVFGEAIATTLRSVAEKTGRDPAELGKEFGAELDRAAAKAGIQIHA